MTCELRLTRVIGLPVILGQRLAGHVERARLTPDGRQLAGLVIRRGLGGARWVSRETICVLGDVSVVLRGAPTRLSGESAAPPHRVTDESGLTLGRVTDAWLQPDTLQISALEVSLGPIEDLRQGRLRVRHWDLQSGSDDTRHILIRRNEWEVLT